MSTVKFRQLINVAIGSPEPGHINFSALHCLLTCIAEKLEIGDNLVDLSNYETGSACSCSYDLVRKSRLFGGTHLSELNSKDEQPEAITESQKKTFQPNGLNVKEDKPEHSDQSSHTLITNVNGIEEVLSIKKENIETSGCVFKTKLDAEDNAMLKRFTSGIRTMKDQLQIVIEHLLRLTFLALGKKLDSPQIKEIYSMAQSLREIGKTNTYFDGSNRRTTESVSNWHFSELQLDTGVLKNVLPEDHITCSRNNYVRPPMTNQYNLQDICYSSEKIFDQLMELKADFCLITNKMNEFSARLLENESQRTFILISEMQEQLRDIKFFTNNLKKQVDLSEVHIARNMDNLENINNNIEVIIAEKIDKTQLEILLADKADFSQLQRKVSIDQMLELQCRVDKKFCEMFKQVNKNEKRFTLCIDNLQETLGLAAIDGVLKTFKEKVETDIKALQEFIRKNIDSTSDDCAAIGARTKVLQNLACLSCDTACVMRTIEKTKVAKLPSARALNILSPLITYELSSLRKSGIMKYYSKDDFPNAKNAWLNHQSNVYGKKQDFLRNTGESIHQVTPKNT